MSDTTKSNGNTTTRLYCDDLRKHVDHELACVEHKASGGAVLLCVDCGVMIASTEEQESG